MCVCVKNMIQFKVCISWNAVTLLSDLSRRQVAKAPQLGPRKKEEITQEILRHVQSTLSSSQ